MLIQPTSFWTDSGEVNVPNYLDKSSFIDVIESLVQGDSASTTKTTIGLVAPHGLGSSTFGSMYASFFGDANAKENFAKLKVAGTDVYKSAGECISLQYDFSDILEYTPDAFLKAIVAETKKELCRRYPKLRCDTSDFIKLLNFYSKNLNRQFVIVIRSFDKILFNPNWVKTRNQFTRIPEFFKQLNKKGRSLGFLRRILMISACLDGFKDLLERGENYLWIINSPLGGAYDELKGWCGVTMDEARSLVNKDSGFTVKELYEWCGGYEEYDPKTDDLSTYDHRDPDSFDAEVQYKYNGVMRFQSVFESLAAKDLVITDRKLPGLEFLTFSVNAGLGTLCPKSDIAFANLVYGNSILRGGIYRGVFDSSEKEYLFKDPVSEDYIFADLAAEGVCTTKELLTGQLVKIANSEMAMITNNVINGEDCYFGELTRLASDIEKIRGMLDSDDWMAEFARSFVVYLNLIYTYLDFAPGFVNGLVINYLTDALRHKYALHFYEQYIVCDRTLNGDCSCYTSPEGDEAVIIYTDINSDLEEMKTKAKSFRTNDVVLIEHFTPLGCQDDETHAPAIPDNIKLKVICLNLLAPVEDIDMPEGSENSDTSDNVESKKSQWSYEMAVLEA